MSRPLGWTLAAGASVAGVVAACWWQPVTRAAARPPAIVLDGVTLLTPGLARLEHRRIVVRGDRIAEISGSSRPAETGGRFVLPGLIDMHVHFPPRIPATLVDLWSTLLLLHGVTTIREVGSLDGSGFALRRQIARGDRIGPRIFACGPVLDGDPPTWPIARAVTSAAEAERLVEELFARGADCIKVYDGLPAELRAATRSAAQRRGLPLVGHMPRGGGWEEHGLDDIQHLCHPRCGDLADEDLAELVRRSAQDGVAHTPTLVVLAGQALLYAFAAQVDAHPYRLLPRFWREALWHPDRAIGFVPAPAGHDVALREQKRAAVEGMERLVRRLHEGGVRLHVGTDPIQPFVVPGASVHRELELLVESGLDVEEALAAATWVAGESLGKPGLGRLEVGAPADLIVLREDPTRKLANLLTIEAVVADGRWYPVEALRSALKTEQSYFERAAVDLPLRALAHGAMRISRSSYARAGTLQ